MTVLTDTHTLVWALSRPEYLSAPARKALAESAFSASVVNLWELIVKTGKPGALLADPLPWWEKYVARQRIPTLSIRTPHMVALGALPGIHRDPFDRMLVAQAITEGFALISKDPVLADYGGAVIW